MSPPDDRSLHPQPLPNLPAHLEPITKSAPREFSPAIREQVLFEPFRLTSTREDIRAELRRRATLHPRFKDWPEKVVGPLLGFLEGEGPLFYQLDTHRLVLGQSGGGKATSVIVPMLLHDDGHAAIVVDPKDGGLVRATAGYRATLGPVHVIDPYNASGWFDGGGADEFNPLAALDPSSPTLVEDTANLARAICTEPAASTGGDSRYWDEEARSFLTGIIVHLVTWPSERADMLRLREITTMPLDRFKDEFGQDMLDNPACGGTVQRYAHEFARHMGSNLKGFESVVSNIRSYIAWTEFQALRPRRKSNSFSFDELRAKGGTLYIVVPDDRLETSAPWLRVMLQAARIALQRTTSRRPVHFVIDESSVFERFALITQALRAWRSSKIRLHLFFQNVGQIRGAFGDAFSSVMDANVVQFLGSTEPETLEFISKHLGERDMIVPTHSDQLGWTDGTSTSITTGKSEGSSRSTGNTHTHGTSRTLGSNWSMGQSEAQTDGRQHSDTRGTSASTTLTESESHSTSETTGTSSSYNSGSSFGEHYTSTSGSSSGSSHSTTSGHTRGVSRGQTQGQTETTTDGYSDSFTATRSATKGGSEAAGDNTSNAYSETHGTNAGTSSSNTSGSNRGKSGSTTQSVTVQLRRSLRPEQVRQLPSDQMIVIAGNEPAAILKREHFFANLPMVERALAPFEPDRRKRKT